MPSSAAIRAIVARTCLPQVVAALTVSDVLQTEMIAVEVGRAGYVDNGQNRRYLAVLIIEQPPGERIRSCGDPFVVHR